MVPGKVGTTDNAEKKNLLPSRKQGFQVPGTMEDTQHQHFRRVDTIENEMLWKSRNRCSTNILEFDCLEATRSSQARVFGDKN